MDADRFDRCARTLAAGFSRRALLGVLGAGGAGLLGPRRRQAAAMPPEDACQPNPGGHCTVHVPCCTGDCDTGLCPCPGSGEVLCLGTCVKQASFDTDPANCGGCGHRCPAGADCVKGTCTCPEGTTECFDACVKLDRDDCICPTPCGADCCTGGTTCCGERCVDLAATNDNCGECGRICPEEQVCKDGSCVCPYNDCGDHCCGYANQCCGPDCCHEGSVCCDDRFCCAPGFFCCGSGCCLDEQVCVGGLFCFL